MGAGTYGIIIRSTHHSLEPLWRRQEEEGNQRVGRRRGGNRFVTRSTNTRGRRRIYLQSQDKQKRAGVARIVREEERTVRKKRKEEKEGEHRDGPDNRRL